MIIKFVLILTISLFPVFSFAQGCITILSEDGSRFTLAIDHIRQNETPHDKIRVDGLLSDEYTLNITFENLDKASFTQNVKNNKDNLGKYQEFTYKIINKNRAYQLKLLSENKVDASYDPPAGMYFTHFGQAPADQPVVAKPENNGGASILITPGVNINVAEPERENAHQDASATMSFEAPPTLAPPVPPAPCQYPMDKNSFKTAKQTIAIASFEDTKFATATSVLGGNCMTTEEIIEVCKLFGFEETKLKFAKFAYSKTSDPANFLKVTSAFTFEVTKKDLKDFVNRGGR